MRQYSDLKKNTIIISIANLGNKFIAFILAPLYSYYLTTSEYGIMDMIITTVSLVMPIVCLNIYESVFRFSSDKDADIKSVMSCSTLIGIVGGIIGVCICFIISKLFGHVEILYIGFFVFLDIINNILSQLARGSGDVKSYAFGGVVNSIFTLLFNIVFMVFLKLGLKGWVVSFFIGKLSQTVYLVVRKKAYTYISFNEIETETFKQLLKFCLPLIPTTVMWWVMNVSDRYAISFFLGTAATGIYAVACKIPSLLSLIENVFYQAWQISAISMGKSKNRDKEYSRLFMSYFKILVIGNIGLLVIIKPMLFILFEKSYTEAWIYVAPLITAIVFHALSGFLGSFYTVFKKTKGALTTTIAGAFANIFLNIVLIPRFGIFAATMTTMLGYIITTILRLKDTKKYVNLVINKKMIIVYICILTIQTILYYVPGVFSYFIRIIIMLSVIYLDRDLIKRLFYSKG